MDKCQCSPRRGTSGRPRRYVGAWCTFLPFCSPSSSSLRKSSSSAVAVKTAATEAATATAKAASSRAASPAAQQPVSRAEHHLPRILARLLALRTPSPDDDSAIMEKEHSVRVEVAPAYRQAFDARNETDDWAHHRQIREKGAAEAEQALKGDASIAWEEFPYSDSPGPGSEKVVLKASRQRPETSGPRPCIFFIHGGLMTGSNRYVGVNSLLLDWGAAADPPLRDAVVLSVEYGRAPESRGLAPSEDCWEALCWAWAHCGELGIDADNVVIYGASAGGCLAASLTLRWMAAHGKNAALATGADASFRGVAAIDPPFPGLRGVYLEAPMLDDRRGTPSHEQYARGDETVGGNLSSKQVGYAWGWLLNEHAGIEERKPLKITRKRTGGDDVSILEAPGRATPAQLSGFPRLCVEVGDADPLRDEGREFVEAVMESGGEGGGGRVMEAAFVSFRGGVPHGGWAIDAEKQDSMTSAILRARAVRLSDWLA